MAEVSWSVAAGAWSHSVVVGFVPQGEGAFPASFARLDDAAQGAFKALRASGDLKGKADSSVGLVALPLRRAVAVGLGKAPHTLDALRMAAGRAVLAAREVGVPAFSLLIPNPSELEWKGAAPTAAEVVEAVVLGAALASFRFDGYRKALEADEAAKLLSHVELVPGEGLSAEALAEGQARGLAIAEAAATARAWVATPPLDLTPQSWADEVSKTAPGLGLGLEVWDDKRLAAEGFGLLTAVGRGSANLPRLVQLTWKGADEAPIVVVGKGLTFDSGGIGIKPSGGMEKMKYDMGGGAAAIGLAYAAAKLKLKRHLIVLVAMAENMPSSHALVPGEIVTSKLGLTVEINDTDAEGRLVMADALAYGVATHKPQAIFDAATLTGAVGVALGREIAGALGNHEGLLQATLAAAEAAGEKAWPLPLADHFDDQLESHLADLKNYGGRWGGTAAAAAFLQRFVGSTPWVHLDVAGTAWVDGDKGYRTKGPTAAPMRSWLQLLETWQKPEGPAFVPGA